MKTISRVIVEYSVSYRVGESRVTYLISQDDYDVQKIISFIDGRMNDEDSRIDYYEIIVIEKIGKAHEL